MNKACTVPLRFSLILCVAFGLAARAAAREVVLVEKGRSLAPVVVFEGAPPKTRQAAEELVEYIEKVTGARPPLLDGEPDPLPESAIWVGYQPALEALFPEVDLDFAPPEEIVIAATDRHLLIAGRDRWDPEHLTVEGRSWSVEGVQQAYGTVNAVYTFLRDYLDVRWLWPGALGEDIVPRETLAFAPFEFRYQPPMRLRSGLFRFSAPGDGRGRAHDWTRFQRLQLDSSGSGHELNQVIGGHAFGDWWERFHETHPEYFALQPDGTRSGYPKAGNAKLCQSNPGVWSQWLADVETQVRENPGRVLLNASPNDGHNRGICVCERCLAWDHPEGDWADVHPEGKSFRYAWQGVSQEYVLMSDRYVTFANQLARRLKARYPEKDYYVVLFAYGPTLPAPVEAVPDDNVIITGVYSCLLDFDVWTRTMIEDWGAIGARFMWRPNTPHSGWQGGPYPLAPLSAVMKSFRYVGENHCMGIYVDTVWELSWATRGPLYYLMANLAWNPLADGRAIMDDYYRRAFGKAAPEMEAYWALIEDKGIEMFTGARRAEPEWFARVFDDAFHERAAAILDRAAARAGDGPGLHKQRIEFVRDGLTFTRLAVEQDVLLKQLKASEGGAGEADRKARANWEALRPIAEANPYVFGDRRAYNLYRWPR